MHEHRVVLITGGCGAIGSVVLNVLLKRYPNTLFVNLDALTYAANPDNIVAQGNYKLVEADITDATAVAKVLDDEQPTLIIHLAAETHVDTSFGNSFKFTRTNVYGTHVLLECARTRPFVQRFIHMSTDEVYGSVSDGETCQEAALFAPSNPYSATKAGAEMLCHAYHKSFGTPVIVARCNNAISPFQHPEKLIPRAIDAILKGDRVPIHGLGISKRTFIDARDIANALDIMADKGAIGAVYNIGTTQEFTVLEVVRRVLNAIKQNENVADYIKFVPDRAFQDYRYAIDSTALRNLGWTDEVSFDDALETVIAYRMLNI